jgi:hypothetical protein
MNTRLNLKLHVLLTEELRIGYEVLSNAPIAMLYIYHWSWYSFKVHIPGGKDFQTSILVFWVVKPRGLVDVNVSEEHTASISDIKTLLQSLQKKLLFCTAVYWDTQPVMWPVVWVTGVREPSKINFSFRHHN